MSASATITEMGNRPASGPARRSARCLRAVVSARAIAARGSLGASAVAAAAAVVAAAVATAAALATVLAAPAMASPKYEYESTIENVGADTFEAQIAGLATDSAGRLYAALPSASKVQLLSNAASGNAPLFPAISGPDDELPFVPFGVAVSEQDGRIYTTDIGSNRVVVYKIVNGQPTLQDGTLNPPSDAPMPTGVALSPDNRLYVGVSVLSQGGFDSKNRIMVFDTKDYGLIGCFGAGHFAIPTAIAFDSAGRVYVVDSWAGKESNHQRVVVFAPYSSGDPQCDASKSDDDPAYLGSIDGVSGGIGLGQLSVPFGVAIDSLNRVHVTESANNRVQTFAPNEAAWSYLARYPEPAPGQTGTEGGSGPGQLNFPMGVAVDGTRVYVADAGNNRIHRLRFDDADADGVFDTVDNCPGAANPDQANADSNGTGDACSTASPGPGTQSASDTTAPVSRITSPRGKRLPRARAFRAVLGNAYDNQSGVAAVEVAIARKVGKRCRYLVRGRLVRGICSKPRFQRAKLVRRESAGNVRWRYRPSGRARRALRAGKWLIVSRAEDRAGNLEQARKRNRNVRTIRLR